MLTVFVVLALLLSLMLLHRRFVDDTPPLLWHAGTLPTWRLDSLPSGICVHY